jgi:hypothetical protein
MNVASFAAGFFGRLGEGSSAGLTCWSGDMASSLLHEGKGTVRQTCHGGERLRFAPRPPRCDKRYRPLTLRFNSFTRMSAGARFGG